MVWLFFSATFSYSGRRYLCSTLSSSTLFEMNGMPSTPMIGSSPICWWFPGRDRRPASAALQVAGHAAYGRPVTDRAQTLRARIYTALRYTDPSPAGRRWRAVHLTVLSIGLLAVILLSIDELPSQ